MKAIKDKAYIEVLQKLAKENKKFRTFLVDVDKWNHQLDEDECPLTIKELEKIFKESRAKCHPTV